jgi:hypothetical protein
MGNSVELLSFPGEGPDGSGWGGGSSSGSQLGGSRGGLSSSLEQAGLSSGVVQQWAAVISVMGSRWSSPLVLATAGADGAVPGSGGEGTAPVAEAVARLPRYEPVLLRAKCRDGCVYDVTVRIESAGSSLPLSTVVRLDPHMVVSNRTGYSLHLVQPEPIWKALGSSLTGPTGGSMSSSRSSGTPGAWFMGDAASSGTSAASQRRGPPTAASATPVRDATLVLRAGSLAVPLSWPQGCLRRLLLLTLPPTSAVMGAAAAAAAASNTLEAVDPVMWSEAFRVDYPATGVMQVLLPLYRLGTPGEPQPVNEASLAAAYAAFDSLLQQVPQQQQQQVKSDAAAAAGRPPLPSRPSSGSGRSSSSTSSRSPELPEPAVATKPLLVHVAKRTEGGLLEYLAVTVNLAVEMPAPGCLHLVLQSLGGEPQQCLSNCTASPISYRQATPRAAWQLLPPFSGAALVLLQPAGGLGGLLGVNGDSSSSGLPSSAEVELRDYDPSTSGSAVCSLDTDSSGLAISQSAGKRSSSSGGAQGAELPATFAIAGGKAQALAQVSQFQGLPAGTHVHSQQVVSSLVSLWSKYARCNINAGSLLLLRCCDYFCKQCIVTAMHGLQKLSISLLPVKLRACCTLLHAQVLPLLESVMAPAGPCEVPGTGSVSVGRTQTDRLLRVLPKPASVSMNQLRLAACIASQDQVRMLRSWVPCLRALDPQHRFGCLCWLASLCNFNMVISARFKQVTATVGYEACLVILTAASCLSCACALLHLPGWPVPCSVHAPVCGDPCHGPIPGGWAAAGAAAAHPGRPHS